MITTIKRYIDALSQEAKASIDSDFDLGKDLHFKSFDYINFLIINKHILEDNSEDLFIGIPENDFRENFFNSVFYSVALIKIYQNYCTHKENLPTLQHGDLLFTKNEIYIYKGRENDIIKAAPKFPKPNLIGGCVEFKKGIYTKLSKEFDYKKRKTIELIQGFSAFLKEKFKDKSFPILTEFPHKTLVIADQKYFRVDENLPTRYWTKTGNQKYQIPVDTLMEVCNDFNTAESYLLNEGNTFDELLIIGDSKYIEESIFSQIQNAKWKGQIKNIILIGSRKPSINHTFKEWFWSMKEIKIANDEIPKEINKIVIHHEKLLNHVKDFKTKIDDLMNQYVVDLSYLMRYINFYLRLIIINSDNATANIKEYTDRIEVHFESDDFRNKFYEKDIYDSKKIDSVAETIQAYFNFFENLFLAENLKWDKIIEASKSSNKIYLIVEKRSFDYIKKQIQLQKLNNIVLISDKRIDGSTSYLDKWINAIEKNTSEKKYFIPFLNNHEIFEKLQYLNGNCFVLCYEGIDEIAFDKMLLNDDVENNSMLNHTDRKKFVSTSFEYEQPVFNKGLESLFELNLFENLKSNYDDSFDAPRDDIFYEITFSDDTVDLFKSSKAIFLVEGKEQIKTTVGEVYENATIRFYKNESPDTFKKILSIFDTNNQMATIDKSVNSWRLALKMLKEIYRNNLFTELFKNKKKIHFNTFSNYLDDKATIRFPRKNTMEAIKDLCIASNLTEIEFVRNFDLVLKLSKEDKRIRQQAGRILGSDLIDYVASGLSEKSDSLSKIPDEVLGKVVTSIVEKKIKCKKILRNDDERIFKQSTIDFS